MSPCGKQGPSKEPARRALLSRKALNFKQVGQAQGGALLGLLCPARELTACPRARDRRVSSPAGASQEVPTG